MERITEYTTETLRNEAAEMIKSEAKAAGCRARMVAFKLIIQAREGGGDLVHLVATGRRNDNGMQFTAAELL